MKILNAVLLVACLFISTSVYSTRYYVDQNATPGGNGLSWSTATTDLNFALDFVVSGDEIWVAEGTYYRELYAFIDIGVSIYGGFEGTETSIDERDLKNNKSIVYSPVHENWSEAAFAFSGSGPLCLVDGFHIINDGGRAILLLSSDINSVTKLIVRNCEFTGNYGFPVIGEYNMYFENDDVVNYEISNCLFNNVTSDCGTSTLIGLTNSEQAEVYNNTIIANFCDLQYSKVFGVSSTLLAGLYTGEYTFKNNIISTNAPNIFSSSFFDEEAAHKLVISNNFLQADRFDQADVFNNNEYFDLPDVLFADINNGDYTLSVCSPAINAGDNGIISEIYDICSNLRIQNGQVDAGCFESPYGGIIYVDPDATGSNNGTSWVNAFTSLVEASQNSSCNSEIWVADGVYVIEEGSPVELKPYVKLLGGFNGTQGQASQRDWELYQAIISGNGGNPFLSTDNTNRMISAVLIQDESEITIDGFTIANSRGKSTTDPMISGLNVGSINVDLNFKNCKVINNNNTLFKTAGSVDVSNCLFYGNEYDEAFFTVFSDGEELRVDHSTFADNDYNSMFGYSDLNFVEFKNCIFDDNTYDNNLFSVTNTPGFYLTHCNIDDLTYSYDGTLDISTIYSYDPLFIDEGNNNYRLMECSPLIDLGIDCGDLATYDLDRNDRSSNGTPDIGSYEYSYPTIDVIYVDINATGSNNGISWSNAYTDLQDAIAAAVQGTQIWVAQGTYDPFADPMNPDPTERFVLGCGVSLYGGFIGNETSLDQRDVDAYETILSGRDAFLNKSAYHILRLKDFSADAVVDGFTFEGGDANINAGVSRGGAIWMTNSLGKINNCTFKSNTAVDGGAIYIKDSPHANIRNCYFYQNEASENGAAIYASNSTLISRNNNFRSNLNTGIGNGGGMYLEDCTANIINNVFQGNLNQTGGAIGIGSGAEVSINFSTFYENIAGSSGGGGAIDFGSGSTYEIKNSIFYGNKRNITSLELNNFNGMTSTLIINHSLVEGGWLGMGANNIDGDPSFTDPVNGNLIPVACSPVIDMASSTDTPNNDIRLAPRVIGEGPDMGAFEQRNPVDITGEAGGYKNACLNEAFALNYGIPQCDSLITTWDGSEMASGIMFDVYFNETVKLKKIRYHKECEGFSKNIFYYKNGTYSGSELTAGDWTEFYNTTTPFAASCSQGDTTTANINNDVIFEQGKTYGLYLAIQASAPVNALNAMYTSNDPSSGFGDTLISNDLMTIFHGRGTSDFLFDGPSAFSRQFEGELVVARYDSIEWYENGSLLGTGSPSVTKTMTGDYTFIAEKYLVDGCSFTDTLIVSVNPTPDNDECFGAIPIDITSGDESDQTNQITGQNYCASASGVVSTCNPVSGRDVWYKFLGSSTTKITFTVTPTASISANFNIKVSAFSGTCGSLTEVGCVDSGGSMEPEILELSGLIPGEVYYLNIDGAGLQRGDFIISWVDPCENTFDDALALPDLIGSCTSDPFLLSTGVTDMDTLETMDYSPTIKNGIFFDVVATEGIKVKRVASSFESISGGAFEILLYYRLGKSLDAVSTPGDWTLAGSHIFTSLSNEVTEIPIDINQDLNPGDTLGIYIFSNFPGAPLIRQNFSSPFYIGARYATNNQIRIHSGQPSLFPPFSGNLENFSAWPIGYITYDRIDQLQWKKNGSNFSTDLEIMPVAVDDDQYTLRLNSYDGCELRDTTTFKTEGKIVKKTTNSGWQSLRSVLTCAEGGDIITFDNSLIGDTIKLAEPIEIDIQYGTGTDVVIQGFSAMNLAVISGDLSDRLFDVFPGNEVVFKNLVLRNGYGANAGAIRNQGVSEVENTRFESNISQNNGNSIANQGNLRLKNVLLKKIGSSPNSEIYNTGTIVIEGQVKIQKE